MTPPHRCLTALTLLLLVSSPLPAQRNQVTVEASVLRGTLGYARRLAPSAYAGVEAGFGFPQLDRTLRPAESSEFDPDFQEYLHLGVFVRYAPSPHLEVDTGMRGSIADMWECGASDCWPNAFAGVYLQPMVGWRRLKFGPRLVAGSLSEKPPGQGGGWTTVVALNPLTARLTIPW